MTITQLYNQLADKDFQDYQTGDLFFPAYMYMYDASKEYEIENEILDIKNRLHRPNNYLDVMVIDIFEEFLNFLKETKFGKDNKYDFYLLHEKNKPDAVDKALKQDAYDVRFLTFLDQKIKSHLEQAKPYEVAYVFVKGFGTTFPYLRTSRFFNNFEQYIKGYKLIMFYPGKAKNYYSLFGLLKDENLYRAIKLINA
ncbi:BREX protein BrxB domain-containing protein [Mariniflexile ostreae]|uniref:BREX protein BrxB domain-containing protein n=1 Tax=Mariniflexile ostreae TaxID=1520892 RepID=A0ABV5FAQ9_9FLAO